MISRWFCGKFRSEDVYTMIPAILGDHGGDCYALYGRLLICSTALGAGTHRIASNDDAGLKSPKATFAAVDLAPA